MVSVLLGNGDGTFQPARTFAAGTDPYSVAVGDFNGDGKPDLVVANSANNTWPSSGQLPGNLSVLLGNGDGTFRAAQTFTTGTTPEYVAVGDFNGDGKADLAVANYRSHNLSVLLGNGDGTFRAVQTFTTGSGHQTVVVGDFNGDGQPDLAVANYDANDVWVLLGNGGGRFLPAPTYPA